MEGEVIRRLVPTGVNDFKKIRNENYYFVDKSELISDILENKAEVHLFTRPRHFGKSLNLSMLDAFFNHKYRNNNWFDGLKVSEHPETQVHKNTHPVIYLEMKGIPISEYSQFLSKIKSIISETYLQFPELSECPTIPESLRRNYLAISPNEFDEVKIQGSVKTLCMMINIVYNTKPVVLIDDYDDPINNTINKKDYERITEFLSNFYSSTLKSNDYLDFAIVTGVVPVTTQSIFSGLNNLKVNNIFTEKCDKRFGFTASEVEELCTYYSHADRCEEAKGWYGGYHFGNAEIYNPRSLMNYIGAGFKSAQYWAGTSSSDAIDARLFQIILISHIEFQALVENRAVKKTLPPRISLNDVTSNHNVAFILMAIMGYLRAVPLEDDIYSLSIPNTEMSKVFSFRILKSNNSDLSEYPFSDPNE